MNAFERKPDVKVLFEFTNQRKNPVFSGYRPNHLIKEDYLTCGEHEYFDVEKVMPGGQAYGTIKFLTPEVYPATLWEGKRITIQEGAPPVGYATVIEVYNPILCLSHLDGAKIIAISELGSYGHIRIKGSDDTIEIAYLAICRYKDSNTIHLFLCDKSFNVENDWDYASVEEAVNSANARSKETVRWNRYNFLEKKAIENEI